MNNNDIRNHIENNYFYHDTSNNNIESNINISQFNRANTEANNYTNTNNVNKMGLFIFGQGYANKKKDKIKLSNNPYNQNFLYLTINYREIFNLNIY